MRCERCGHPPEDWLRRYRMPDRRVLKLCRLCIEELEGIDRGPNSPGDRDEDDDEA